jgi:hypothetical protein
MSMQKTLTASAMAALCVLAASSPPSRAGTPDQAQAQAQARNEDHPDQPGQDGMVVVRDAKTGKMRAPTADELKALRPRTPSALGTAAKPQTQAQALTRRNGARGVRLGEKTMVYEVVTRGADGKLTSECLHDGDAAEHAVHAASSPSKVQAKEHAHESR